MIDFINCKKYLLSLDKRQDRRDLFFAQNLPYRFEVFRATEPKEIYYPKGRLKSGQVACKISHSRIIQDAKNNNHPYIFICEDDAKMVEGFEEKTSILKDIPENWDMIYIGAHHYNKPEFISDGVGRCVTSLSTVAYMVNSRMYDTLLKELKRDMILDVIYTNVIQQSYNCYCLFPNLVIQNTGYSDIEQVKVNYDKFYNKWL